MEVTSSFEVAGAQALLERVMQGIRLHSDSWYAKLRPISLSNILTFMRPSFDVNK